MKHTQSNAWIIETNRIGFRRLNHDDFDALIPILGDIETMYAWEYGFSSEQITQWIDRNIARYAKDGFSYFAAIDKESCELIGQMGILIESIEGAEQLGIGYILAKKHWGKGYAEEGARALAKYAFCELDAKQLVADIRPQNSASRKVAERLGMKITGEYIKSVNGKQMPHLIYVIDKEEFDGGGD